MSNRSAARGRAAASSIRLTLRTSNAVATSNASPSRCFLFCDGSRAARSARTAAATVSIPPIPKAPPNQRRSLRPHQPFRPQEFLMGGKDPKGLWVEALVYNQLNPAQIKDASANASDGTPLTLTVQGISRTLQGQANVVHFAIQNPPPSINVGQPVTVAAKDGAAVEGIIVPREAVVRGSNGESLVWRHTDPERFEPRPVRTEALKAIGWSVQKPRPRHPASATPEEREAFKKSSSRPSLRREPSTRTRRSKSGPRTNTASA